MIQDLAALCAVALFILGIWAMATVSTIWMM
jgi:hypothetical protein